MGIFCLKERAVADIVGGLIIIALSVFFYIQTLAFPTAMGYEKMGGEFWPRFTLLGIVVMAIIIMIDAFLKARSGMASKEQRREDSNTSGVAICGIIIFFFILLISYVGFVLSAFFCFMVLMYAFGERKKLVVLSYSIVMVGMVYLLFGKFLFVPLPRGVSIFQALSYYLY